MPTDGLDIRILRELTQAQTVLPATPGLRASLRTIAATLGVAPGTVRNRLGRMYTTGVLRGSSVYANPSLLGLRAAAFALEVASRKHKDEVVARLLAIPGAFFLQNFRGPLVGIAVVHEDDRALESLLQEIRRIAGARPVLRTSVPYPPCTASLGRTDWRLLLRLTEGSFASYQELARELRVSVRTLKRSIARLTTGGAIFSVPTMDYRALTGCVPADLLATYTSGTARAEAEREILATVDAWLVYAGVWPEFGLYSLILPRVSSASDVADAVRRLPGVRSARMEFVEDHIDRAAALADHVRRRAEVELGRPVGAGARLPRPGAAAPS
ncbi:MAG TPA: HTH domain-containing protein [Thermoplasmata archaeon]|nr:HTH domain-containing protein [Thermoplasmata archaeon]